MNARRWLIGYVEGVASAYLLAGGWIVHCAMDDTWTSWWAAKVWLTWPWMFWIVTRGT